MKIVLDKQEIADYVVSGLISEGKINQDPHTTKKYHLQWTVDVEKEEVSVVVEQEDEKKKV
jgi:hypothetical protein